MSTFGIQIHRDQGESGGRTGQSVEGGCGSYLRSEISLSGGCGSDLRCEQKVEVKYLSLVDQTLIEAIKLTS